MRDSNLVYKAGTELKSRGQDINKSIDNVTNKTKELASQAAESLKQSGNDWLQYVNRHPIQCMLYGVILYFAAKGMWKK